MLSAPLINLYVGIDIKVNESILSEQRLVCSKFNLIPRKELHVTIAYFQSMSEADLELFGESLKTLALNGLENLTILGLGGAYSNSEGSIHKIEKEMSHELNNYPRVLWWTVELSESLLNFRNALISIAMTLNLTKAHLRPTFYPHITIGSGGPQTQPNKWSLWDTHLIEKTSTILTLDQHKIVKANKLHVTNSTIHPEGLFLISNWSG